MSYLKFATLAEWNAQGGRDNGSYERNITFIQFKRQTKEGGCYA